MSITFIIFYGQVLFSRVVSNGYTDRKIDMIFQNQFILQNYYLENVLIADIF